MNDQAELVASFMREFELCALHVGEVVGVLTSPQSRAGYADAACAAASACGATVFELSVPGANATARNATRGNAQSIPAVRSESRLLPALRGALLECDFIADLVGIGLLPFREELQKAGKRILTVLEPPDVLERLFPTHELRESVEHMRDRFTNASRLRHMSPAGTDISYDISGVPGLPQYGFVAEPGRWDQWGTGQVNIWPVDGSAGGRVVLQAGDIIYPFKRYCTAEVTIEVEGGYIREIGGGLDAKLIREYLESWKDPEAYATAHVTIGMHPLGQWSSLPFYDVSEAVGMDGRGARGSFLFTTGSNRFVGRFTEAHFDITMFGCSAFLDDEPILVDGQVIDETEASGVALAPAP